MKVKKILQEDMMSLPGLREELITIRDERAGSEEGAEGNSGRTLSYELRKSIDHADTLSKCSVETAKKLYDEPIQLEKTKPEIALKIVNIFPQSREEVRAIYAKERITLVPEDVDQILDIIHKYE